MVFGSKIMPAFMLEWPSFFNSAILHEFINLSHPTEADYRTKGRYEYYMKV